MIEVEKKFILTKEQEKNLVERAKFLGEKIFTDIYYDDAQYILTGQDIWFRERDGKFELKVPLNKHLQERVSDQYRELETEKDIMGYFEAGEKKSFAEFLMKHHFKPFCQITTTRKKYKKEGFVIDLDIADFGYTVAEVESTIDDELGMEVATQAIIAFAKKNKIDASSAPWGKVIEYLRLNNPAHFEALIVLGVINKEKI